MNDTDVEGSYFECLTHSDTTKIVCCFNEPTVPGAVGLVTHEHYFFYGFRCLP